MMRAWVTKHICMSCTGRALCYLVQQLFISRRRCIDDQRWIGYWPNGGDPKAAHYQDWHPRYPKQDRVSRIIKDIWRYHITSDCKEVRVTQCHHQCL